MSSLTSSEQFLRAVWNTVSWASVLILSQIKLNLQLSHCTSFFSSVLLVSILSQSLQQTMWDVIAPFQGHKAKMLAVSKCELCVTKALLFPWHILPPSLFLPLIQGHEPPFLLPARSQPAKPGKMTLLPTALCEGQQLWGSSEDSLGIPMSLDWQLWKACPEGSLSLSSQPPLCWYLKNWLHQVLVGGCKI